MIAGNVSGVSSKQTRAVRDYGEPLKRDPDRDAATRATSREQLGAPRPRGFKELLAACPLGDLELDRARDRGRDIDL